MNKQVYTTVKGYLKFNLKDDVILEGKQRSLYKDKTYKLSQQRKQCDKAFKALQKQESKGLITNLSYTESQDGSVIIMWERVV